MSKPPPPFRFGVQASSPPDVSASSWRNLARKVEDLGYTRLTIADHMGDQLGPFTSLMAAADATSTLRVGALVLCNDFRHPVVVAKEAATLDLLSEGRFELGLGAGWVAEDYARSGIPMDRPGVRIARLGEAAQIIRGLLGDGPVSFDGEHYRISDLEGTPKPLQRPLPILMAGGGRKVLELAARHADIVGLNPKLPNGKMDATSAADGTVAATERKIGWVREAAGDRFDSLELHTRIHLAIVTDDRHSVAAELAPAMGLTPQEALETPHALCGSVDEITDHLLAQRERLGIASIGISLDAMDALAPVVARLADA